MLNHSRVGFLVKLGKFVWDNWFFFLFCGSFSNLSYFILVFKAVNKFKLMFFCLPNIEHVNLKRCPLNWQANIFLLYYHWTFINYYFLFIILSDKIVKSRAAILYLKHFIIFLIQNIPKLYINIGCIPFRFKFYWMLHITKHIC